MSELVRTDFKFRYQGSVLGYAWSLLRPLFLFGILLHCLCKFLKFGSDIPHYPVYLLLGIVLWNFFGEATRQGASAIVSRGALLRKISFPRYIIVVSATVSALINLGFNLVVVIFFIILVGADVQLRAVVLAPLLILELYVFALAIAFYLSAINVKYRDIEHIWDIIIQAGFYATPILYSLTLVQAKSEIAAFLMFVLNPVAQVMQDMRYLLVTPQSFTLFTIGKSQLFTLIPLSIIALVSLSASIYFKKKSKTFAEDL